MMESVENVPTDVRVNLRPEQVSIGFKSVSVVWISN